MEQRPPSDLWQRLQQIPRHYIYLLLSGVIVWQLLAPIRLPILPSPPTRGVYDAIRAVPAGKLIVISTDWDASTQAETGPQTRAVVEACFQAGKPFALMNLASPMGAKLGNDIAVEVGKEYHAEYGVEWCNWGYKAGGTNVLLAMARNIPKTMGEDIYGKPVAALHMMQRVRTIRDVGLAIEVTGFAGMTEAWVGLIQGPYRIPFAAAYTAVMAPGYYQFLDSGQLEGMLVGAKGAAEMESLVNRPGAGTAIMSAQSWAHVLIIVLIIFGNLGFVLTRAREKGRER